MINRLCIYIIIISFFSCGEKEKSNPLENNSDNNDVGDKTPPTVVITSPANGVVLNGHANIKVEALDDSHVNKVSIFVNGSKITDSDSYNWDTMYSKDQVYTIYGKAWDDAGNEGISQVITVTTSNSAQIGFNYILNPGFENGDQDWTNLIIDSQKAHSGNMSACVVDVLSTAPIGGELHLEKNQHFKLTLWHYYDSADVEMWIGYGNGGQLYSQTLPSSNSWQLYEWDFGMDAQAVTCQEIRIRAHGVIYIDDVSLIRLN
jgi:hypothetical protein